MAKEQRDDRLHKLFFVQKFHENQNQPLFAPKGFYQHLALIIAAGPDAAKADPKTLPDGPLKSRVGKLAGDLASIFLGNTSIERLYPGAEALKLKRQLEDALLVVLKEHRGLPRQENNHFIGDVLDNYREIVGIRLTASALAQPRHEMKPVAPVAQPLASDLVARPATVTPISAMKSDREFERVAHHPIVPTNLIEAFITGGRPEFDGKALFVNLSGPARLLQNSLERFKGNDAFMKAHNEVKAGINDINQFRPQGTLYKLIAEAARSRIETMHSDEPPAIRETYRNTFLKAFREAIVKQFPALVSTYAAPTPPASTPQPSASADRTSAPAKEANPQPTDFYKHAGHHTTRRREDHGEGLRELIKDYFGSQMGLVKAINGVEGGGLNINSLAARMSVVLAHTPHLLAPGNLLRSQIEKAAHSTIPAKAEEFLGKLDKQASEAAIAEAPKMNGTGGAHSSSNGHAGTTVKPRRAEVPPAKTDAPDLTRELASVTKQLLATQEQLTAGEAKLKEKDDHIREISLELRRAKAALKSLHTALARVSSHVSDAEAHAAEGRKAKRTNGSAGPNPPGATAPANGAQAGAPVVT